VNKLDRDYLSLIKDVLKNGNYKEGRNGGTRSVFSRHIRHKMSDGFPLLTTKKMPWKVIVTELIWFLRGHTNIKELLDNNCNIWNGDSYANYLKKQPKFQVGGNNVDCGPMNIEDYINKIKTDDSFAKKWGDLGKIYGSQWRNWGGEVDYDKGEYNFKGGIDQIQVVIDELKSNPDSRRIFVSAWNVAELSEMVLPPCHNFFQFYTRVLSYDERVTLFNSKVNILNPYLPPLKETLELHNIPTRAVSLLFNMRSSDVGLGLPFNLASYGLLLKLIGVIVNMVPEELIANLGDVHLYSNHIEPIKPQLKRRGKVLPDVLISSKFLPNGDGETRFGELDSSFQILINNLEVDDFKLINYNSHDKIKLPLSN